MFLRVSLTFATPHLLNNMPNLKTAVRISFAKMPKGGVFVFRNPVKSWSYS